MTTISCVWDIPYPLDFTRNPGVSRDAETIREGSDELKQSFARTISFGGSLSQILDDLIYARQEYSRDNWDKYGAKSIDKQSFEYAKSFAFKLPSDIPIPETSVMPSGQVAFIWSMGIRRVFSIIVGIEGEIFYAGLYGLNKTYGTEYFRDGISNTIIDNINKVYS